jgi:hypothetical protein
MYEDRESAVRVWTALVEKGWPCVLRAERSAAGVGLRFEIEAWLGGLFGEDLSELVSIAEGERSEIHVDANGSRAIFWPRTGL